MWALSSSSSSLPSHEEGQEAKAGGEEAGHHLLQSSSSSSLYTLLGGSVTLNHDGNYPQAVGFGETEILATFQDKIRLYDFSPSSFSR